MRTNALAACAVVLLAFIAVMPAAHAQQPTDAPSATLPGPGLFTYRPMFRYESFRDGPGGEEGEIERSRFMHHVTYGVAPEWGLFAELSIIDREAQTGAGEDSETGLGDARVGATYRFYRNDFGPLNTFRAAAEGSLRLPTGSDEFSSDSVNTTLGVNTTTILGRHGINTSAQYEITTGETELQIDPGDSTADRLSLLGAHLYRLSPASYAEGDNVAVYSQVEVIGHAETNGDASLDGGLGVLVEAPRWAAEFSVILPVLEDLNERPRKDVGLALGFRFLF